MTTAGPNRNDVDTGHRQGADCLLYLLGELDAESSRRFEEQLADNPDLCNALLEQASLITSIALNSNGDAHCVQRAVEKTHARHLPRWRWVAAVVSVAACIAMVFQLVRFASPSETVATTRDRTTSEAATSGLDESVLIAKAWAISHHTLKSETAESQTSASELDEFTNSHDDETFELVLDEQSSDIDTTLSWMFVAIASTSEADTEEGNDG